MNFYKRCPHPALQSYIHHYAVVEFGKPDCWSDLTIVPPGCAVLAIVVGDKKVWIEDGEGPTHYWDFLNFIGQVTHNKNLKIFGPQKLIYVVFQPYGAYRILGVDQQHCIDSSTDLLDMIPAKERRVEQQFMDCQTADELLPLVENWLAGLLTQQKERHYMKKIASVYEYIAQQSHENLLIQKISKKQGCSVRTLERHFKEGIGISPKQYQRIVRFNHVISYIRQHRFINWTDIVYQFGYYDQPHFINDFNLFYGKTPTAFSIQEKLLSSIVQ